MTHVVTLKYSPQVDMVSVVLGPVRLEWTIDKRPAKIERRIEALPNAYVQREPVSSDISRQETILR